MAKLPQQPWVIFNYIIILRVNMFPSFNEMPFTYLLCGLILLSGIIGFYYKPYYQALIFHPYEVFKGRRIHTLFTSAFVHTSWWHLIINTYIFFGAIRDVEYIILEEDYATLSIKIICFIILISSIVLSNLLIGWHERFNVSFTSVGFSGAVFGFISFALMYLPLDHPNKPYKNIPLYYAFEFAFVLFITLILMRIVFRKSKTNHKSHLIGFIVGFVMAVIFRPTLIFELSDHLLDGSI